MLLCSTNLVEVGFELQRHAASSDIMDSFKPTFVYQNVFCIIMLND